MCGSSNLLRPLEWLSEILDTYGRKTNENKKKLTCAAPVSQSVGSSSLGAAAIDDGIDLGEDWAGDARQSGGMLQQYLS